MEIAISVYYKRFLKYEHVFGMCLIWTSIIIFLNPLSLFLLIYIFFFLVMSKNIVHLCPWVLLVLYHFSLYLETKIWISMSLFWFALCWFCDLSSFEFFSDHVSLLTILHLVPTYICWFSFLYLIQSPSCSLSTKLTA